MDDNTPWWWPTTIDDTHLARLREVFVWPSPVVY